MAAAVAGYRSHERLRDSRQAAAAEICRRRGPAPEPDVWAAKLRGTDVIYFGLTKKSTADNQPAWRIVESLQRGGARVALGWTDLPATQQPLLDQWQRQEISGPQLLDQLATPARGDWLRHALRPDLIQLALGSPPDVLRKIRAGEALSAEERALLPNDYRPRPDAFDNFADRVAISTRLRRYDMARLYRTHLAAEQMIAENIVRFMHDNPGGEAPRFSAGRRHDQSARGGRFRRAKGPAAAADSRSLGKAARNASRNYWPDFKAGRSRS